MRTRSAMFIAGAVGIVTLCVWQALRNVDVLPRDIVQGVGDGISGGDVLPSEEPVASARESSLQGREDSESPAVEGVASSDLELVAVEEEASSFGPFSSRDSIEVRLRLQSIPEWDQFYATARALTVSEEMLQEMTVARVCTELGLDKESEDRLSRLVCVEQDEVTVRACVYHRSADGLIAAARTGGATFWKDLRDLRGEVRKDFDGEYLREFGEGGMELINRHLRSSRIKIEDEPDMTVRVVGVGQ